MKTIFNSLGSNYSLLDSIAAINFLLFAKKRSLERLKEAIKYQPEDRVVLTYKGRDAIQVACEVLLPQNSLIFTQALSCFAVEEGIVRAGMKPIYVDIKGSTQEGARSIVHTNPDLKLLKKAYKDNPEARAVFIQHSLGNPAEIEKISDWCKKKDLFLIEDVAQSYGAVDTEQDLLGKHADAVVFSFGRDKILDAVSGGAVIFRAPDKSLIAKIIRLENNLQLISPFVLIRDMLYPILTYLIRTLHSVYFGRVLFVVLRKIGFLTSPVLSPTNAPSKLHPAYAHLALRKLQNLQKQLKHRRLIALEYTRAFRAANSAKIFLTSNLQQVERASNQRYSIVFDSPKTLAQVITNLKENNIYVSDRWYRSPVDCGSYNCSTVYVQGQCETAEYVADRILNLPTHKGVSLRDAKNIVEIIDRTINI